MYEKILVLLDGSKTAEPVLPNVVRLACESKAKGGLFTVDAPPTDAGARKLGTCRGNASVTLEKPDIHGMWKKVRRITMT